MDAKLPANDCDALLRLVMGQAKRLKIPISPAVDPHVRINSRAVSRFGCCRWEGKSWVIEISQRLVQGPRESCMETLAHELLHTCWGCRNHGGRWKGYAQRMNEAYGYQIRRASTNERMGVEEARAPKYVLRCDRCGLELRRFRASALTRNPERYRCRCGGELVRIV